MLARIHHITIDCRHPYRLAQFWAGVLGFTDDPSDPNDPDDTEVLIVDPAGHHPGVLFIAVPDDKAVKNRVHLDLQPSEARDTAVERVQALGGRVVSDHRRPDGSGWVVMADPEGNELCVERSAQERGGPSEPVDTGERPMPPIHVADERTTLIGMLDWYRAGVVRKVEGVSPRAAAAVPFGSSTSIAGIVKHLALVEDSWFTHRFAGEPEPEPWVSVDWDADRDWEFHTAVDEPMADLLHLYEVACERARVVVAEHELDDVGADTSRRVFSLRFVLVHLIEETARHLGHLDLLREHLDGTTGE